MTDLTKRATSEVFKVQRPLGGEMSQCLVYNKDRSIDSPIPYTDEIAELFAQFDNPGRLFVEAWVDENGTLQMEDVVPDPCWDAGPGTELSIGVYGETPDE